MTDRPIKTPGPDHPVHITQSTDHIVVLVAGQTIADTRRALVLQEASYPPVYYIPRADVDVSALQRTEHHTYCPYKGDCSYYSIPAGGGRSVNAIWTYETPYPAVAAIQSYMAFYPDRVDRFSVEPA
ncbi:DUF427 domain-containing protein [Silvimonas sp. JCM 19000]